MNETTVATIALIAFGIGLGASIVTYDVTWATINAVGLVFALIMAAKA